jgi:Interferon-induced 6-16 family
MAVSFVAPPALITAAGFGTGGVVAGSLAAGVQSRMGNVAPGSAFALLQYAGTVPLVSAGVGAAVGAGSLVLGYGAAVGAGSLVLGYGATAASTVGGAAMLALRGAFAWILGFFMFLRESDSTSNCTRIS